MSQNCNRGISQLVLHPPHVHRMYKTETTEICNTGLRYKSKENGSPFVGMGGPGETRSCIQCGKHKMRSKGSIHRFLNALMFFCADCKPVKFIR